MDPVLELAKALAEAKQVVVLTGAGASTESGLPDFRSKEGLWQSVDPAELISLRAIYQRPVEFYQFYRERLSRLWGAEPNRVHQVLAAMQKVGIIRRLITQNVDGLHQQAGSTEVIEVHGSLREAACLECGRTFSSTCLDVDVQRPEQAPSCPDCQGPLKPGVILFGEPLPEAAFQAALQASLNADLFIVIGSSLEVGPVNQLPSLAVQQGARLAIINLAPTHLDSQATWVIRDQAGEALSQLAVHLGLS